MNIKDTYAGLNPHTSLKRVLQIGAACVAAAALCLPLSGCSSATDKRIVAAYDFCKDQGGTKGEQIKENDGVVSVTSDEANPSKTTYGACMIKQLNGKEESIQKMEQEPPKEHMFGVADGDLYYVWGDTSEGHVFMVCDEVPASLKSFVFQPK